MKKILVGANMIEFMIDGIVESRMLYSNASEKSSLISSIQNAHPDVIIEEKEDVSVNMADFEAEANFDWRQSLIELSEE